MAVERGPIWRGRPLARGETETLARGEKGSGAEAEKEWLLLGEERGEGRKQFWGSQGKSTPNLNFFFS